MTTMLSDWARRLLARLNRRTVEELDRKHEERAERLLNDPFSFASWEAFVAYRARHGLRTRRPRRRDRDPSRHPYEWLARRRDR